MTRLRIVVSGATGNAGLAIIRALGRARHEVIGADRRRLPFGLHSRYSSPYCLYESPDKPGCLASIIDILSELKPDVFLPMSTSLSALVCSQAAKFSEFCNVLCPDVESFEAACDNGQTIKTCHELGIGAPEIYPEHPGSSMIVVKPRRDIGGARGVEYVDSPEAADEAGARVGRLYGEVILQEFIPGPVEAMRTALLLFDNDSQLVAYFTTRKIRQWPSSGGLTALSVSTQDRDLVDYVRPIFDKWKWRGPVEVEFKDDTRDGKPKLIEINPRFPSYVGFSVACGLNWPELTCQVAAGVLRASQCPDYSVGRRYFAPSAYINSVASDFMHHNPRRAVLAAVAKELRAGFATNRYWLSDPGPRIGKVLLELRDAL